MSEILRDVEIDPPTSGAQRAPHPTRPFLWSLRRELWENRATYIAPAAVAALLLLGALLGTARSAGHGQGQLDATAIQRLGLLEVPYGISAVAVALTMVIVAVFYALGALHNERRDRSILFWKSLPVSDLTTVLAKAAVPLLVMPIAAFFVIEVMEFVMYGLNTASAIVRGDAGASPWASLPFVQIQLVTLYTLVVTALWFAPLYAWLLFISGWARRAPFLWAFLPPLALALVEKIALGTNYVGSLIADRLRGFKDAFTDQAGQGGIIANPLSLLDPLSLVSLPGLWLGLLAAAALLGAAVWCRRRREPI